MTTEELRTCRRCGDIKPLETGFYRTGGTYIAPDGTARIYYKRICKRCQQKQQRAYRAGVEPPKFRRMKRFNARGDAWCPHCQAYLPVTRFRPHPTRPGTLWSYCRDCTMARDRDRYNRKFIDTAVWRKELDRRTSSKRNQRQREQKQRREFVLNALSQLRRKGLADVDIAELTGISTKTFWAWRTDPARKITPQAEARLAAVLLAALPLPVRAHPLLRGQRAEPELRAVLRDRCAAEVEATAPMRSRWRNREAA